MSPELAEICGIHAGDGYLREKDYRRELDISGSIEEKDYYDNHVRFLFKTVFGIDIKCRIFPHRNTYGFVIRDRKIIEFMHNLGFPYGAKSTTIKTPEIIMNTNNKDFIASYLRGLFDTDGCLHFWKRNKGKYSEWKRIHHYYPIIKISTISETLFLEILRLLSVAGFGKIGKYTYKSKKPKEKVKYTVTLYGPSKAIKFFKEIGSKNPVKLSRFQLWKEMGFCPAHTTLKERLEMLKKANNCINTGL